MAESFIQIKSPADLEVKASIAAEALLSCFQASIGDETEFGINALHASYHTIDLLGAGYRLLCDQPEIMNMMLQGYWDNDSNHNESTDTAAKASIRGHMRRGFAVARLVTSTAALAPLANELRLYDRAYAAEAAAGVNAEYVDAILFGHTETNPGIPVPIFADQVTSAEICAIFPEIKIERAWGKSELGLWFLWLRRHRISLYGGGYNLVGTESAAGFRKGLARFCGSDQSDNRAALLDIFNNAKTRSDHIAHDPDLLDIVRPFLLIDSDFDAIAMIPELKDQIRLRLESV